MEWENHFTTYRLTANVRATMRRLQRAQSHQNIHRKKRRENNRANFRESLPLFLDASNEKSFSKKKRTSGIFGNRFLYFWGTLFEALLIYRLS
jgi:hypothetical protein